MAGDDFFTVKFKILRANWCLLRQPKPDNTWPAQDFLRLLGNQQGSRRAAFFVYVSAGRAQRQVQNTWQAQYFRGFEESDGRR